MDERMKRLLSILVGLLSAFTKQYGAMILMVAFAICFDLVTGLIKAEISGTVSSSKGTKGLFKKLALLVGLFFGFFLDYAIPYMCKGLPFELTNKLPFGMIICTYIVLNECISICENLYVCNPNIIPKWIVNMLQSAKERVEDGGQDGEERKK